MSDVSQEPEWVTSSFEPLPLGSWVADYLGVRRGTMPDFDKAGNKIEGKEVECVDFSFYIEKLDRDPTVSAKPAISDRSKFIKFSRGILGKDWLYIYGKLEGRSLLWAKLHEVMGRKVVVNVVPTKTGKTKIDSVTQLPE